MPEPKGIYLYRLVEGNRCVAEIPIIVHDAEAALRIFNQALPRTLGSNERTLVALFHAACSGKPPERLTGFAIGSEKAAPPPKPEAKAAPMSILDDTRGRPVRATPRR